MKAVVTDIFFVSRAQAILMSANCNCSAPININPSKFFFNDTAKIETSIKQRRPVVNLLSGKIFGFLLLFSIFISFKYKCVKLHLYSFLSLLEQSHCCLRKMQYKTTSIPYHFGLMAVLPAPAERHADAQRFWGRGQPDPVERISARR